MNSEGAVLGDITKLRKVQNDVNFIKNLHLDEMPVGYGTFQSSVEIDSLYTRMDKANEAQQERPDQDIKKIEKREAEQDLMASRVIKKFNDNSERVLSLLAKQKKVSTTTNEFIFNTMDREDRLQMEGGQGA